MSFPLPEPTDLSKAYWDALADNRLVFQKCRHCGHAWLPARAECPECWEKEWQWTEAVGEAKVVSWVVYHHSYHPEFTSRIPYVVALVELKEGPRMISGIVGSYDGIAIDKPLRLQIEKEHGFALAKFRLSESEA